MSDTEALIGRTAHASVRCTVLHWGSLDGVGPACTISPDRTLIFRIRHGMQPRLALPPISIP